MMRDIKKETHEMLVEAELEEQLLQETMLEHDLAVNGRTEVPRITPVEAAAIEMHLVEGKSKSLAAKEAGLPASVFKKEHVEWAMNKVLDEAKFTMQHVAKKIYEHSNNEEPMVSLKAIEIGGKMRTDIFAPKKIEVEKNFGAGEHADEANTIVNKFLVNINKQQILIQKGEING